MSVTMHLYKPVYGVSIIPGRYYISSKAEQADMDINFSNLDDENLADSYFKEFYETRYSDGKEHTTIIPAYYSNSNRSSRLNSYKNKLSINLKDAVCYYNDCFGTHKEYIVDEICYAQGWFFSKEFFRKENTLFCAFSKEEMIRLLDRYLVSSRKVSVSPYSLNKYDKYEKKIDEYGNVNCYVTEKVDIDSIKNKFIDAWDSFEDKNLVFEIAF